jgi:hypothetical protein
MTCVNGVPEPGIQTQRYGNSRALAHFASAGGHATRIREAFLPSVPAAE